MSIFNSKGMLIIPNPATSLIKAAEKVIVLETCYCPNKHNLISDRANFNGYPGILIKVLNSHKQEGLVALSPVYGDKSRITIDIKLVENEILELLCPHCGIPLPLYSQCSCKASLIAFYITESLNFGDCVGVCNRVGCVNAELKNENQLLNINMLEVL